MRRIGTSWAALGPSLRRLGASWSLLGASWDRCGTSWKRPASDSNQKFDFFIDFCFQLRPPKPSKSNPRCMESSIFKMRFLKLTSIFVAIMLVPTDLYFELMFNVLGALRASWERPGRVLARLGDHKGPQGTTKDPFSWKRLASDSNQTNLIFLIDVCSQLRPPKPSKSSPRARRARF